MDLLNHHPGKDGFRLRGVSMSRGCLIALVKHLTGRYRGPGCVRCGRQWRPVKPRERKRRDNRASGW